MVSRVPFSACLTCPDRARNATGRSGCRSGRSGGATPNADCGRTHGDARTALSVATPRCDPGRSHTDDPRPVPAGRRPCPAGLFRPGAAAGLCAHGCQTVNRTFRRSSRNRAPMWQTRGETWVNLPPVWCVPGDRKCLLSCDRSRTGLLPATAGVRPGAGLLSCRVYGADCRAKCRSSGQAGSAQTGPRVMACVPPRATSCLPGQPVRGRCEPTSVGGPHTAARQNGRLRASTCCNGSRPALPAFRMSVKQEDTG